MMTHKAVSAGIISTLILFSMHIALFAEKPKDAKHTFSYRGIRMCHPGSLFYVTKIETETEPPRVVEIEIKFNMPADPRTLQKNHIAINDRVLPADALVAFNKAGDKMKIVIQTSFLSDGKDTAHHPFHIDLPEAKSFNHIPLYRSHFDDIGHDKEYTFKLRNMPLQKPPKGMCEEMQNHQQYEYVRFEEED